MMHNLLPRAGRGARVRRRAVRRTPVLALLGAAALSALGLAATGAGPAHAASGTVYYVSTTGSDSAAGTSLSAPFQTVSRCAAVAVAGDTCEIEGGTYAETVQPANSGSAGAPITFEPYDGESVTVTGASPVTGWTQYQGDVYKAPATLAAGYDATENPGNSDLAANQVFQNGSMLAEAQYPAPGSNPEHPATATASAFTAGSGTTAGTLTASGLPALPAVSGTIIDFTGGWTLVSGTVTASSAGQLSYTIPASDSSIYPPGSGNSHFRVLGSLSLLTQPGEWFYDSSAHELYVWAPNSGVPSGITAKARNYAFVLDGREDITIQGLNITASTILTDADTSAITVNGITASYLSHFETQQYDSSLPYDGVYDAAHRADTGIIIMGNHSIVENSTIYDSAGNGIALGGSDNTAQNNLIHDVAYGGTYTSGVTLFGLSTGQLVTQNTIYSTARDGININSNVAADETFSDNRISYNDISDYGTVQHDLGGIYTCCNMNWAGSRIDHNTVHDPAGSANGIYLDNGTYDVQVDHNVTWGNNEGLRTNGTSESTSKTNILIYNNTFGEVPNPGNGETGYGIFSSALFGDSAVENNIMAAPNGPVTAATDQNNLVYPSAPGFANQWANDYQLATGSAAIGAGVAIPGVTVNSSGTADLGAFETAASAWTSGCGFAGCHPTYPVSVDDSSTGTGTDQIDYSSGWSHCGNCSGSYPLYDNTNSWSTEAGATATFSFTGKAITFDAVEASNEGYVDVSVDGGTPTQVDLYAAARTGDVDVWNSGSLSEGAHTLKITVVGSHDSSASSDVVAIDRLVSTP